MPNHVTNIIKLSGDKERIAKLLEDISSITVDEDGELYRRHIDFNKIIPMPKKYDNLVSGSITDMAIAVYLAKEENDYSMVDKLLNYPCYKEYLSKSKEEFIDYLISREATIELGKRYVDNYRKYGAYTWYEWCNKNWGTKWNAYSQYFNEEENEIVFDTAWNGVPELIEIISKNHPLVGISYSFADEDIGYNTGSMDFFAGIVDNEYYPEPGSREAYEHAAKVKGWTEEELDEFLDYFDDDEE